MSLTSNARGVSVVVGLLAMLGVGFAVSRVMDSPSRNSPADTQAQDSRNRKAKNVEGWLAVPQLPLAGLDESGVAELLATELQPWLGALPPDRFDSLLRTLAAHLVARVDPTLDDYVAFAESDSTTRWATSSDTRAWDSITHWYAYHTKLDKQDAEQQPILEMLAANIELQAGTNGGGLVGLGVGEGASWGMIARVRSEDELMFRISESMSPEESSYWFENTGQEALPFQVPVASLDESAAAGPVQAAVVCLIVTTEGGSVWNLHSRWFWDEPMQSWICDLYSRKSHGKKAYIWF